MRKAKIFVNGHLAGILEETEKFKRYRFDYIEGYAGLPVSLNMPVARKSFIFDHFPPFFEGVLPEGFQLQALLKQGKIDANDYFQQLVTVGHDLVGNVTIEACT